MSQLDDHARLCHMLDAARKAVAFLHGRSRSDLVDNEMLALAIVKCIEIIGEAATQVEEGTSRPHSHLPWQEMKGIRNRLVHAYFDVDLNVVWFTVTQNLPPLIEQLEKIVGVGDQKA